MPDPLTSAELSEVRKRWEAINPDRASFSEAVKDKTLMTFGKLANDIPRLLATVEKYRNHIELATDKLATQDIFLESKASVIETLKKDVCGLVAAESEYETTIATLRARLAALESENYTDLMDQMTEAWGEGCYKLNREEVFAFISSRYTHKPTTRLRARLAKAVAVVEAAKKVGYMKDGIPGSKTFGEIHAVPPKAVGEMLEALTLWEEGA